MRDHESKCSLVGIVSIGSKFVQSIARFIFEIIQNADANNYSRAEVLGAQPYIKSTVYLYDLVIERNEDPDDVKALCMIGEWTKTRANDPYSIDETGAGLYAPCLD
jgi:hypothetical protein